MNNTTLTSKSTKVVNKETVKACIDKSWSKWDKHAYYYACSHMTTDYIFIDSYKKRELIDMFYQMIETNFYKIEKFTDFKKYRLLRCFL